MGFLHQSAPIASPPPANPATTANASVQDAGAAARAAAAAANGGAGYDGTLLTSATKGAATPSTSGGKATLGDK